MPPVVDLHGIYESHRSRPGDGSVSVIDPTHDTDEEN
jgi:hypothetical protein